MARKVANAMMVFAIGIDVIRSMIAIRNYWIICRPSMLIHKLVRSLAYGLAAKSIIRNPVHGVGWKDMFYRMVAPSNSNVSLKAVVYVLAHKYLP